MLRTPFDFLYLGAPGLAIPDLQVVVDAGDDDVATKLRVLDQRRGQHDPPLLVGRRLGRPGEEEALHLTAFRAERVERAEARIDEPVPGLARVRVQATVHAAR